MPADTKTLSLAIVGTCACGKPATGTVRTGISPGKWTEPKPICDECWKLSLPKIPTRRELAERRKTP